MWQLALWEREFGGTWASYKVHHKAAVRHKPNRISVMRMERMTELYIVARMKGEIPDGRDDHAKADGRAREAFTWFKHR